MMLAFKRKMAGGVLWEGVDGLGSTVDNTTTEDLPLSQPAMSVSISMSGETMAKATGTWCPRNWSAKTGWIWVKSDTNVFTCFFCSPEWGPLRIEDFASLRRPFNACDECKAKLIW